MATTSPSRLWILCLVAAVLAGFLFWPQASLDAGTERGESGLGGKFRQWQELRQNLAEWTYLTAAQTEIETAYFQTATAYADRMAGLVVLSAPGSNSNASDTEAALNEKLRELTSPNDLQLTLSEAENFQSQKRYLADITIKTQSSEGAAQLLQRLANPHSGTQWRQFNMTADRNAREITITGRLSVLAIEAAE